MPRRIEIGGDGPTPTAGDIQQFRDDQDWTQAQAAKWAGYSLRHWIRIENGEVICPRPLANRLRAILDS